MVDERELTGRLRALRGMEAVLAAVSDAPAVPVHLVGGAVRDLLLDREPVDLDLAIEGDVDPLARALAGRIGGTVEVHERFGTASVDAPPGSGVPHVNLAQTRRETYSAPGALPEVEPAPLPDDLTRRDFTVNAIAVRLDGSGSFGALSDPGGGRADLADRLIRVLHPASFADDPTRLLRAVRYAARLGFALERDTERWAREGVAAGAPATVSGPRLRDELVDLLAEQEAPRAVELLAELGLDGALHPGLRADAELVAAAVLGCAETGADPALAGLAALATPTLGQPFAPSGRAAELDAWIAGLGLDGSAREAVLQAAHRAPSLADALGQALRPSELHALLAPEPPEAFALALALGAPAEPLLEFLARLRGTRLEIDGRDLIAAGVPESPAIGRALAATLARKLDGELDGRQAELAVALAAAREGP